MANIAVFKNSQISVFSPSLYCLIMSQRGALHATLLNQQGTSESCLASVTSMLLYGDPQMPQAVDILSDQLFLLRGSSSFFPYPSRSVNDHRLRLHASALRKIDCSVRELLKNSPNLLMGDA